MSNFIRYLLYRSKDYEIASVDRLANECDAKRIYVHRNHKFYLGDVTDRHFMERVIHLERPDVVVNGIGYNEKRVDQFRHVGSISVVRELLEHNIPIVQLVQSPGLDALGTGNLIANLTFRDQRNAVISLPNCFGFRQKTDSGLAFVINEMMSGRLVVPETFAPTSWAYAEDVASLIWFVIENGISGEVAMPVLGIITLGDLANLLAEILETTFETTDKHIDAFSDSDSIWTAMMMECSFKTENIEKWSPDSSSLKDTIAKTARWYKVNRWAIEL